MSISLLETLKQNLTRQLDINIASARITQEFVEFVDDNVRKNPGKSSLRFNISESDENLRVTLYTLEKASL